MKSSQTVIEEKVKWYNHIAQIMEKHKITMEQLIEAFPIIFAHYTSDLDEPQLIELVSEMNSQILIFRLCIKCNALQMYKPNHKEIST